MAAVARKIEISSLSIAAIDQVVSEEKINM
jgi:hypothetical protein